MADAVRLISIRRGYDPRDFALVAFGGAGGLHGADVARELSIPHVIVPPNPGVTSALGCLLVDIRHDLSTMFAKLASEADEGDLEEAFASLEAEAVARLRVERVADENIVLRRTASMRYAGQWRSLSVQYGRGAGALAELIRRFHEQYEREYAFRQDGAPVEIYQLGLTAIGTTPKPELTPAAAIRADSPTPDEVRDVYFDERGWQPTPVWRRDRLGAGNRLKGPAVIEQLDATTLIPPETRAEVDEWLNIRIQV
jgi:N-methylhydantoinase A